MGVMAKMGVDYVSFFFGEGSERKKKEFNVFHSLTHLRSEGWHKAGGSFLVVKLLLLMGNSPERPTSLRKSIQRGKKKQSVVNRNT